MKAKIITTQKRSWNKCNYFQLTWMADVKAVISDFSRDWAKHIEADSTNSFTVIIWKYWLALLIFRKIYPYNKNFM